MKFLNFLNNPKSAKNICKNLPVLVYAADESSDRYSCNILCFIEIFNIPLCIIEL